MALLIYLKGNTQPLTMKGSMKDLEEKLKKLLEFHDPDGKQVITMEAWFGQPVMFFNPFELLSHVAEKKDSVVKKEIADTEKAMKEKQRAMDKAQGKNIIQKPNMFIPNRREH